MKRPSRKPSRDNSGTGRSGRSTDRSNSKPTGDKPSFSRKPSGGKSGSGKPSDSRPGSDKPSDSRPSSRKPTFSRKGKPVPKLLKVKPGTPKESDTIRLNKYISNAGICSRREADTLIAAGTVQINGVVVTELGTKVQPGDNVKVGGQSIQTERKKYLLLNKPKDYITTVSDTHNRRTVMDLVKGACKERLYPVGRLDRATTGIILLTNDGEMAKKLTHPSHGVEKLYHVALNKNVAPNHLKQLTEEGVKLEDGISKADEAVYVGDGQDRKQIGMLMHSGKNRIVRRMLEGLGYRVVKLDRVKFAGLSKKSVPRGKWRFLTETEINLLKMLSA